MVAGEPVGGPEAIANLGVGEFQRAARDFLGRRVGLPRAPRVRGRQPAECRAPESRTPTRGAVGGKSGGHDEEKECALHGS